MEISSDSDLGWEDGLTLAWPFMVNVTEWKGAQSSSPCRHGHGGIRHRIPCFRMESATLQEQGMAQYTLPCRPFDVSLRDTGRASSSPGHPLSWLHAAHVMTTVKLCLQSRTLSHTPKSSEQLLSTSAGMLNELPKFSVSDTTPNLPQKICSLAILRMVTTAPSSHGSSRDSSVALHFSSVHLTPGVLKTPTHSACPESLSLCLWSSWSPPGPVTIGIHQLLSYFSLVPCNIFSVQFFF